MNGVPLLRRDHVVAPLETATLDEAVLALAERLADTGTLGQSVEIGHALHGQQGTAVRIGADIALPHFRTPAVESVVVALGVSRDPLTTGDPGWLPGPRIVVLVLAPAEATSLYLQAVSAIARALRAPETVERLLACASVDDVWRIQALTRLEIKPRLTVHDAMLEACPAASPDQSVREAVDLLLHSNARALPVVGDKGVVLGIVSEAGILEGIARAGGRSDSPPALLPPLRVRDVMTRSVLCVADSADLDEVANLMIKKDMAEIPVVVEGKLAGIVRREDILRTLYGR
jgi:CBS domain-containing protein